MVVGRMVVGEGEEGGVQLTFGRSSGIVRAGCWLQVVRVGPVGTAPVVLAVVSSVQQDPMAVVVVAERSLLAGRT